MKKMGKSWMAVLAAALLLGALVGVVWSKSNDRAGAADITRKVTLTGADFIPGRDGDDWRNWGDSIVCETDVCGFYAPVVFPCLPSVTVERIRLHVEDNNVSEIAEVTLYRAIPPKGKGKWLGETESPEGTSGGFQTYDSGPINKVVWPSQRAYVYLGMYTNIYVYGVTIEYRRNV